MRRFRVQLVTLILSIGVGSIEAKPQESREQACRNPNTDERCSRNGICRSEYDYGEGEYHHCDCYSYENQPPWFGPDDWSNSTKYRGVSGKWCQCKEENCPGNSKTKLNYPISYESYDMGDIIM